jgi:hypothetical protein
MSSESVCAHVLANLGEKGTGLAMDDEMARNNVIIMGGMTES